MEDDESVRRLDVALSGGGIRSATFSLGVLQALAERGWFGRIRTLSTVSGGGYIGAFLCRLASRFAEPKLPSMDNATWRRGVWQRTADVLLQPTKDDIVLQGKPALNPLQWLRENSRYLAPSGSSDMAGGLAYYLRGLLALHFDIAVILLLFASLNVGLMALSDRVWSALGGSWDTARSVLSHWVTGPSECAGNPGACPGTTFEWIFSGWWLVAAILFGWMLVVGIAYWYTTRPAPEEEDDALDVRARKNMTPILAALSVLVVAFCWIQWGDAERFGQLVLARLIFAITALSLFVGAAAWLWKQSRVDGSLASRQLRVDVQRRRLTWMLTRSLQATGAVMALAVVDTLALSLAEYRLLHDRWLPLAAPAAGYVAVLAAVWKWLVSRESKDQSPPRWMRYLQLVLLLLAVVIAACLLVFYQVLAYGLAEPQSLSLLNTVGVFHPQWMLSVLLFTALALCIHFTPGFLNLSTFHNLYSARLKRAYLGAANPKRLHKLARNAELKASDKTKAFVNEVVAGDEPDDLRRYMAMNRMLGIEHVVNVTINQRISTTSPTLAQDRQGVAMCLDQRGAFVATPSNSRMGWRALGESPLSLAQWISISGAAFSVGVGKETRIGYALMAFLANVRTAYWWRVPRMKRRTWFEGTWTYLWEELRCKFRGTQAEYWYLSDGGHFDNTAVYELLRRRAPLVFASDNGADPDYHFDDLAHLLRRIRIDLGAEAVIRSAGELAGLGHQLDGFGTPQDFERARKDRTDMPFALWIEVTFPSATRHEQEDAERPPDSIVVFVKPGLPGGLPADVAHYARTHPDFPQETTGDQFFDEAQWESYRALGQVLALRLLKQGVIEAAATRLRA